MSSFRLWTIFYVFALLASAMATFGIAGVLAAAVVLAFWAWVFTRPQPATWEWVLLLLVCGLLVALLLPPLDETREYARSRACLNNLKGVALATIAYEVEQGQFPPVHTVNSSNEPLLSWRVSLLPRLEQQGIFSSVTFDEAWNGPKNRAWSSLPIDVYCCPSDASALPITNYFAVVGAQTAWPASGVRKMSDITDGPAQTILLIEDHGRDVHWAEPKDLSFREAVDMLSKPSKPSGTHRLDKGFFYKPTIGRSVVFADGRYALLNCPISRQLAEALLTVDGGEKISSRDLYLATRPQLDYGRCYGVGLFVVLSLLPAAWLGKRNRELQRVE
jgi:hypothetical protein